MRPSEPSANTTAADAAYAERNCLVALLARLYPSGIKRTAIEGWDPEWHGCVYIDLPTGQASWHYHDSETDLFDDLPPYHGEWDGHSTEEKYRRVRVLMYHTGHVVTDQTTEPLPVRCWCAVTPQGNLIPWTCDTDRERLMSRIYRDRMPWRAVPVVVAVEPET